MDSYRQVRCLFCQTGIEWKIVREIAKQRMGFALFGEKVKLIYHGKQREEESLAPLLPGYVFVYTSEDSEDELPAQVYHELDGVIRVLNYGESGKEFLVGKDLEFADWLWRIGGRVEILKAIQVGDRVEIVDELFKGLRGTVVHMDRRKKAVKVRLEMETSDRFVTLSYRVVEKLGSQPPMPAPETQKTEAKT